MEKIKENKGIALITFIIILIVLLIAVGIIIVIFVTTNIPKDETENIVQTETANENINGTGNVIQSSTEEVNVENIKEYTSDGVPIPKGFYYVGGTKDSGIVISDSVEDENKGTTHEAATQMQGNQFVWIPVEEDNDFKRYTGYSQNKLDHSFMESTSEPYEDEYANYAEEKEQYDLMRQSVLQHDGFYVARYEASKDETNQTNVASKQGKEVWNYISWGDSMSEIGTEGAVYQAQQMYTNKDIYGVTSTLIYGVQWDAIMAWIDPKYKTGDCDTSTSFVTNSTGKGIYKDNRSEEPSVTGSDSNYAVKNIYDLAGNVSEWTMEAYSSSTTRVLRGGSIYYGGSYAPASFREVRLTEYKYDKILGFRVALYL